MLAALKPLGVWGIGGLAVIDSSTIPVPIDALLIDYVANDHKKFLLYCFMAALGSAVGSMLPYYLGRAGGELFLLKRINRQRYEQLRDRFEKQEFLAIMVPAMMPPPMPVKLFEFASLASSRTSLLQRNLQHRAIPFVLRHLILSSVAVVPSCLLYEPQTSQSQSPALDSSPSSRCDRSSAYLLSSPSSRVQHPCPPKDCTSWWSSTPNSTSNPTSLPLFS